MSGLAAEKAALRKAMVAVRERAHAQGQGAAAAQLAAVLAAHGGAVLAGYHPMRSEMDPLPALGEHRGATCLPVVMAPGQPLVFRAWTPGAALVPGGFGTQVPPETAPVLVPRVLIVPLLAFDMRGYRLGYGGGFYDRTLAGLRAQGAVLAIGFACAAQQVTEVPTEATDQRLDLIVTENGVLRP